MHVFFSTLILLLFVTSRLSGDGECSMPDSKCSGSAEIVCKNTSGCQWNLGKNATCSRPISCSSPQTDKKCSTGCYYHPGESRCSPPSDEYCDTFSVKENCWSKGCEWYPERGCHRLSREECREHDSETCTAEIGCSLQFSGNPVCRFYPAGSPCWMLDTEESCSSNAVCQWRSPSRNCVPTYVPRCDREVDELSCTANTACQWNPSSIPPMCRAPNSEECGSIVPSKCEMVEGCQFYNLEGPGSEYCRVAPGIFALDCYNNSDKTGCDARSDEGCNWVVTLGNCSVKSSFRSYCESSSEECLDVSTNAGCKFNRTEDSFSCRHKGCAYSASASECPNGCIFTSGSGYCTNSSYGGKNKCYDNDEKNGCDIASKDGCVWTAYCGSDPKLSCIDNSEGTGCDSDSVARGCVWRTMGASCLVDQFLSCDSDMENADCNSSSDLGCEWHPVTAGLCTDMACRSNADGSACTEDSITKGCVWVLPTVPSSSSIVYPALVMLLMLFVLLL